jgi:hypothetical protein
VAECVSLPVESVADTVIVCVPAGVPGVLGVVLGVLLPLLAAALAPPQPESEIKPPVRNSTARMEYIRCRWRFIARPGKKSRNVTLNHATGSRDRTAPR